MRKRRRKREQASCTRSIETDAGRESARRGAQQGAQQGAQRGARRSAQAHQQQESVQPQVQKASLTSAGELVALALSYWLLLVSAGLSCLPFGACRLQLAVCSSPFAFGPFQSQCSVSLAVRCLLLAAKDA